MLILDPNVAYQTSIFESLDLQGGEAELKLSDIFKNLRRQQDIRIIIWIYEL